ncbi:hypothetical protein Ctob_006835 [Chrysochromulina tobinii]|uniref:Potassium channel domain-containing protein n=1 Tax=Chrysochromulina tobinii TaxID=1460289 RepID=A0A0M0K2R8_9EUKA|nr:hypothetical protein Ctob_006835 [Chrysochromulina tobinii]|eukprot:KOO33100.1 hypothetical protein Ctob_006835 [Chrysochromulina sp. CCMP291]
MSPPRKVTINGAKERKAAGIPLECKYFAFAYPLDCLAGMFDELVTREGRDEPWLNFLLFGGYVYFDASRRLVRSNAIVLTQAMAALELHAKFGEAMGQLAIAAKATAEAANKSTQPAQLALQSPHGAEFSHPPSAPEAMKAAAGMPTSGITAGKSSEPAGEALVKSVMQGALQGTMKSYALALMLVLVVVALGMVIAMGVHKYSTIDALYWTIGCMTTAGGDLHADTNTLKMVYIIYMPLGAVTMLTAGRTVLISSQRRGITMDNFSLQLYDLLGREARRKTDKHAKLREADFIVSVLQARKMVDLQTIEVIRKQFAALVPRNDDATNEPAIDVQLVFDNLFR